MRIFHAESQWKQCEDNSHLTRGVDFLALPWGHKPRSPPGRLISFLFCTNQQSADAMVFVISLEC